MTKKDTILLSLMVIGLGFGIWAVIVLGNWNSGLAALTALEAVIWFPYPISPKQRTILRYFGMVIGAVVVIGLFLYHPVKIVCPTYPTPRPTLD